MFVCVLVFIVVVPCGCFCLFWPVFTSDYANFAYYTYSKRKLPKFHAHAFLLEILTMNSHLDLDVKLLSLNVRGLNKSIKRRSIFRWLHNQKLQFAFLQETYSSKNYAHIWEAEWGGKTFFSHGTSHSKGVMTLINPRLDFKVNTSISDKNGRFLILDLVIDEAQLILVNIYAPNDTSQQVAFFKELEHHLAEFAQENVVSAGDFNCALASRDKKGGNPVSKKTLVIKEIERLSNLYNLIDIWRNLNPHTDRFTWRNKSFKIQCHLDFFLISKDLINDVQSCNILNAPESNHSATTLHLRSKELKQHKGPGFWKFNSSLLEDEVYINKLRENIILFQNKYFDIDDSGLRWPNTVFQYTGVSRHNLKTTYF